MPELQLPPGFIDLHCHLLHGVDDGPPTLEAAAQMCGVAHAGGTVAVVATPHASHCFPFDPTEAAARRAELEQRITEPLRVFAGCEIEMSLETLPMVLAHARHYTLNGSRYLLMELLATGLPPCLDRLFARLQEQGLVPILAHPERSAPLCLNPERLQRWVEQGCLAQVTADALTGRMGRRIQQAAWNLLGARLVHFVASDGHDPVRRPPRLREAYRAVYQGLAPQVADLLFIHNPLAVLQDRAIRTWPAY